MRQELLSSFDDVLIFWLCQILFDSVVMNWDLLPQFTIQFRATTRCLFFRGSTSFGHIYGLKQFSLHIQKKIILDELGLFTKTFYKKINSINVNKNGKNVNSSDTYVTLDPPIGS
jgi:hypothetical protein